ncbi:SnoaL-like domain-containing protein OS=Tsukamurella paurometabola (strain ATCC 8368 / DSM /CCUG 35730 / CIP 100753 / JCM 10117 / KCTC 9821 / NBRC 16120/ NCIMB 702349 / NCTC 13040) OX=521096 GN=Tpau_3803 PE=4 SV=1 [Tsukamurella paurometabola]|uniref:SnoaL-like domain-containing protein n=1 Tax=Tsukamurella paurometabola (strain ATCC 8368 / DSM 20162 / CCUG 35730 / CIP 100753 / JCM 10117 / KCTC 9821 / NBRC 16120 / NCIMB 702349 / NCTC 13040) TaxID=521096 RepID=D5UYS8_TSUPD|nr:nuclear transport factor 2 family protein [Tsukamurella paurometabola]ADG80381.1 conserved hypothetical protein [Tsukamurella paurometabola DSM 20162]SUP39418.1 SnoaL-like domain [Tsukamurella paurometabola]
MPTAEAIRTVVEASPAAVAAHDKQAWTALFAAGGAVHDPVGSRPQTTPEAISRFYDMFIAPNRIVFDVEHDIVDQDTMIRDLTVHTTMNPGVTLHIPMHLRYTIVDGPDGARISALYAHWELRGMIAQLLRSGASGMVAGSMVGPRLFRILGREAALGFLAGLRGVGAAGRDRAVRLLRGRGLRVEKVLAAGATVTATVYDGARRGVAVVDFSDPAEPEVALHF